MNSWITEDDSVCVEKKPVGTLLKRSCNEFMCPPEYVPQPWSEV